MRADANQTAASHLDDGHLVVEGLHVLRCRDDLPPATVGGE